MVSSLEIIDEIIKVLKDFKIKMSDELINEWIKLIAENSEMVEITGKLKVIKEDPDDDKFIETALIGNADFIISQDKKHLLKIKEYKGIKIIHPKEFYKKLNPHKNLFTLNS